MIVDIYYHYLPLLPPGKLTWLVETSPFLRGKPTIHGHFQWPASQSQRQQIRVKRLKTMKSCTTETHRKDFFFSGHYYSNIFNLQQYNFSLHLYIFRSIRCHKIPACRLSPARLPSKMSRTSQVMTDQNMYIFFGSLQLDTETTTLWYRNKHIQKHHWLVVSTSLKNIVSWDDYPNMWKNKKCSKPPQPDHICGFLGSDPCSTKNRHAATWPNECLLGMIRQKKRSFQCRQNVRSLYFIQITVYSILSPLYPSYFQQHPIMCHYYIHHIPWISHYTPIIPHNNPMIIPYPIRRKQPQSIIIFIQ